MSGLPRNPRPREGASRAGRRALFAAGSLALGLSLAGCTSTQAPRVAAVAPKEEAAPPPPAADPRLEARQHFYRGKTLALAGEAACARQEFQEALDTFRGAARPGDPDDLEFAGELYESVALYDRRAAGSEHPSEERPPAENAHDSLVAQPPSAQPEEIATAQQEVAVAAPSATFDIPVVVNEKVLKAIAFYQFRTPQHFAAALQRSGRYLPMMRQILKDAGLPQDLVYVAMVESAFKHAAHSRAAAHGFWQFIDGTGRRYGLRKTREIEERSDPVKSTKAAAAYFRDLYEMFGDWCLAMAAYDTGEGRVLRALQATGARDYWELSAASNALHRETRDYVPFIMAAAIISKDPAKFGFDVVPDPPMSFEVAEVDRRVDLAQVARATGAPLEEIQTLNAELRLRTTPRGRYQLRVPAGTVDALLAAMPGLPEAREVAERKVTVRRGDTMARIAKRYRVSVADLCDWNDLSAASRPKRGTVLVIASRGAAPRREPVVARSEPLEIPRGQVRAIPTPSAAVTSASQIGSVPGPVPSAAASTLPARYDIGSEGFVPEPATPPAPAERAARRRASDDDSVAAVSAGARPKKVVYTVKRGDTLFRIAQKYGVSVDAIRKTNRMGHRQHLAAGKRLTLVLAGG